MRPCERLRGFLPPLLLAALISAPALQHVHAAVAEGDVVMAGNVTGMVTDASSGRPLSGVQMFIEGSGIGALTNAAGRYLLLNVPNGQVTVTAQLIGFGIVQQTVTVAEGQTATLNFQLESQALGLDEIVVTGTPGGTQRRAVGNVVDQLEVSARTEVAPASNVMQLLSQQSPGLHTPGVQGMVGTGTAPRIRGVSSMNLGNQPLLYVDGVRVDNNTEAGPSIRGGRMVSRMNDFDPEDIESIEIIKGPAAATLYGTEASSGVIHIITKKGLTGAPVLEFVTRQGANYLDSPADRFFWTYWGRNVGGVYTVDSMNIYAEREAAGNPIFTYGHQQNYNLSVRGGTDLLRYYVSAGWDDEVGIVDYNWNEGLNLRTNLSVSPNEEWDISASMGYTRIQTRFAQAESPYGIWEAVIWARPDARNGATQGFRYQTPESAALVDSRHWNNRFTGSFTIAHNPLSWLTHRAIVGIDFGAEKNQKLFPRLPDDIWADEGLAANVFWGARALGDKTLENGQTIYKSFDYGATATFDITPSVRSSTSAGIQFNARQNEMATSYATIFPTPGVTTVSSGAVTRAEETFLENKTLGTYVQQQFALRNDRLFITGAVRGDDNSAFGSDFDAAIYPKFSATWVISEESFFDFDFVDQLRLRTAWGQAGRQPGAFDAITLYDPIPGPGGQPAVTPRSLGDPGLKPEVGEELELGFDASLFGRVGIEFTYYNKKTKDALASDPIIASAGFLGSQLKNIGLVENWGTEIGLTSTLVETGGIGFDLQVNFATHKNEIKDLGDIERSYQSAGDRAGFPIGSVFSRVIRSADFLPGTTNVNIATMLCDGGTGPAVYDVNGDGTKETGALQGGADVPCATAPALYRGHGEPEWSGSVTPILRIGQNLRISATTEFKGGPMMLRTDNIAGAHRSMVNTPPMNPITDPFIRAYITAIDNNVPGYFNPSFARMREISASYNLPSPLVERVGASRASVTLGFRNPFFVWRKQEYVYDTKIFDPEQQASGDETSGVGGATVIPPLSQVLTTFRITF